MIPIKDTFVLNVQIFSIFPFSIIKAVIDKKIQDARKCDLLVSIMTWVISYVCFCNSMFRYDKKISGKQRLYMFVCFVCLFVRSRVQTRRSVLLAFIRRFAQKFPKKLYIFLQSLKSQGVTVKHNLGFVSCFSCHNPNICPQNCGEKANSKCDETVKFFLNPAQGC